MDFGHALTGPAWTSAWLDSSGDPTSILNLGGPPDKSELRLLRNRLTELTDDDLRAAVMCVPSEWGIDTTERDAIVGFCDVGLTP